MNIKQFRIICKVSSVLLKLTAAFMTIVVITSLFTYFFYRQEHLVQLNYSRFYFLQCDAWTYGRDRQADGCAN